MGITVDRIEIVENKSFSPENKRQPGYTGWENRFHIGAQGSVTPAVLCRV
jgi:hypothetical protein